MQLNLSIGIKHDEFHMNNTIDKFLWKINASGFNIRTSS